MIAKSKLSKREFIKTLNSSEENKQKMIRKNIRRSYGDYLYFSNRVQFDSEYEAWRNEQTGQQTLL